MRLFYLLFCAFAGSVAGAYQGSDLLALQLSLLRHSLSQLEALSAQRRQAVGSMGETIDKAIQNIASQLKPAAERFKNLIAEVAGDRVKLDAKLAENLRRLDSQLGEVGTLEEVLKADFKEVNAQFENVLPKLMKNSEWARQEFSQLNGKISENNDKLDRIESRSKLLRDNLGQISQRQNNEMAMELARVGVTLAKVQSNFTQAAKKYGQEIGEQLAAAQALVDGSIQGLQSLHGETDRKITDILAAYERFGFVALYGEVWQRMLFLRKSQDQADKLSWAVSVTDGDRHGMSMAECLFNVNLMIMGESRAFQMRPLLSSYLETANMLLDQTGGASQRLLLEMAIEEFQILQQAGYRSLAAAYRLQGRENEALACLLRAEHVFARQSILFQHYLNLSSSEVQSEKMANMEDAFTVSSGVAEIESAIVAAQTRKPLLGCRFCKGCDGLIEARLLTVQCKFAEEMNFTSSQIQWSGERIHPRTFSELNTKGGVKRNSKFPSGIDFVAVRYTVVDPSKHLICGVSFRRIQSQFALGVDVCETGTMKLITRVDPETSSPIVTKRSCTEDNSLKPEAISTADRISLSWNALDYGVGSISGAGLCTEQQTVGRQRPRIVNVLKLHFDTTGRTEASSVKA